MTCSAAYWSGGQDGATGRRSSVQPDGRVEVPGSADFDHVELAGQRRRERLVGPLAFHDAPYRFIDFRHATGDNEGHRLHGSVASNGHRHHGMACEAASPLRGPFRPQC